MPEAEPFPEKFEPTALLREQPSGLNDAERDWANSPLWQFIANDHVKFLVKRGKIKLSESEKEAVTQDEEELKPFERLQRNLNPEKADILFKDECDYVVELLRKQMDDSDRLHNSDAGMTNEEKVKAIKMLKSLDKDGDGIIDIDFIYEKAERTIAVLRANLVKPATSDRDFFDQYKAVTPQNVVRLCIYAQQLYEARADLIPICKVMTEIEHTLKPNSVLWCILQQEEL